MAGVIPRQLIEEELCGYCDYDEGEPAVKGGPNGPIYLCTEARCELAYQNYKDEKGEELRRHKAREMDGSSKDIENFINKREELL
jgi:hypothetical protein